MKRVSSIYKLFIFSFLLIFAACAKDDISESVLLDTTKRLAESDMGKDKVPDDGNGQGQGQKKEGLITAGEWNDLSNWKFWENLQQKKDYHQMFEYWNFYTNNRIAVVVENNNKPVVNAKVELLNNDKVIWATKTDNFGSAELWIGLFQHETLQDLSQFKLQVNGKLQDKKLLLANEGVNKVEIHAVKRGKLNKVELSFIVDATGSMGDELEFLKADLKSVITKVQKSNANLQIYTSTVFYRDEGDDYITKTSKFTNDLNETVKFIGKQSADGGNDFPEAVHTALDIAINQLSWSENAKTRIAFLLLDAPPHYEPKIVKNIHSSITSAASKGIKIIPITASGIDKKTEFLMRFMAIATNSTYVFITNDSGIGNKHIEPSVGQYKVEYLNALLERLIKKYTADK